MKICLICKKELTGRRRKFCSNRCKCSFTNNVLKRYSSQREKGIKIKFKIFNERGGGCEICGYGKNLSAIHFHHKDPKDKKFGIDLRSLANNNIDKILLEINKCLMICGNCHAELHNPECKI